MKALIFTILSLIFIVNTQAYAARTFYYEDSTREDSIKENYLDFIKDFIGHIDKEKLPQVVSYLEGVARNYNLPNGQRRVAIQALGEIKSKLALPVLYRLVSAINQEGKNLEAIYREKIKAKFWGPEGEEELKKFLANIPQLDSHEKRLQYLYSLWFYSGNDVTLLKKDIVKVMGNLGDPAAIPFLLHAVDQPVQSPLKINWSEGMEVLAELASPEHLEMVEPFINKLKNITWIMEKFDAIKIIVKLANHGASKDEKLFKKLEDVLVRYSQDPEDKLLNVRAHMAIFDLTGKLSSGNELKKIVDDENSMETSSAVRGLHEAFINKTPVRARTKEFKDFYKNDVKMSLENLLAKTKDNYDFVKTAQELLSEIEKAQ